MMTFVKSLPYALAGACILSGLAFAQAPAGASGTCKDGTYTTAASKRGACSGHGGVKDWFADQQSAPTRRGSTAQAPAAQAAPAAGPSTAQAPGGATGTCKDGTSTTAASKRGACSGHGGVKEWFADQTSAPARRGSTAQAPAAQAAPTPGPSTAQAPAAAAENTGRARTTAAPGGGRGQVWVNTASKVYHCAGDEWYGKTEKGAYKSETAAQAEGDRPARNKTCS